MPLGPPEDPTRFEDFEACVDALSEDMPEEQARRVCGSWENRVAMQKDKKSGFRKSVEFKQTDDAEQVATGIVMVPDTVDLQGDYVTDDTIAAFAEQFANFEEVGEAGGGVMHTVWPSEHIALEDNRVLDSATDIGADTAPAGAWVQSWHFNDDELYGLVADGILDGYSIGAVNASWDGPVEQADLPDGVDVADAYPDDEPAWELTDGIIQEVSTVDIPAVPDAEILDTKSRDEAMKRLSDHLGDREAFIDEAKERGHSEAAAGRMWEYLDRAVGIEGADEPGASKGAFARAGKAFFDALTPGKSSETTAPDGGEASKESRTLSQANRERLMAAHDALESAMASDMDFRQNRFSDDPGVDFDVADYSGKTAPTGVPGGEQPSNNDATDDSDKNTTMSDDDPLADAPEWAKAMHDDIEENSKAVADLTEKVEGDPDDPEKDAWDDAPEWAKDLRAEQDDLKDDVDALADKAGKSQQLGGGGDDPDDEPSKADFLGIPGGEA